MPIKKNHRLRRILLPTFGGCRDGVEREMGVLLDALAHSRCGLDIVHAVHSRVVIQVEGPVVAAAGAGEPCLGRLAQRLSKPACTCCGCSSSSPGGRSHCSISLPQSYCIKTAVRVCRCANRLRHGFTPSRNYSMCRSKNRRNTGWRSDIQRPPLMGGMAKETTSRERR